VGGSLPRRALILKLVAAAYLVALATLPFAHHDLACHLKSSTHCAVCHVGTSADPSGAEPALPQADLADAGRADHSPSLVVGSCALRPSQGRSPPSNS
jgi:hypothetical protein